jgi:hypothetical protein
MTALSLDTARPRSKTGAAATRLSCDAGGNWSLIADEEPVRRFTDFEAALEGAHDAPGLKAATIEVWQGGEYICCLPLKERARPANWIEVGPTRSKRATSTEYYANRAARIVFAIMGPIFWLALMVVALAASMGWRLALL